MSVVHDNIRRAAQRINPDGFLPVNSYDPETGIFFLGSPRFQCNK